MSRQRERSAAYRARRRARAARRRNRASEARDYFYMLERTPGYAEWLDREMEFERAMERAEEWDTAALARSPAALAHCAERGMC